MKKILLGLLAVLVAFPAAAFVLYDITQFQPHRNEINALLAQAAPQDREPPEQVIRMLRASERNGLSIYASRLLVHEFNAIELHGSMLGWHLNSALWCALVKLHLSERDQMTIILAKAPTGNGRIGFSSTALSLYQKQPSELSTAEVATVVALIRLPAAQGEALAHIRNMLLARYSNGA